MYSIDAQKIAELLPQHGQDKESARQAAKALDEEIDRADAVLVGAAAGMSSAAGYDFYYHDSPLFYYLYGDFSRKYGWKNSFSGFYHPYQNEEERWALIYRSIYAHTLMPAGRPYQDLITVLGDKPFHVMTTNQDWRFSLVLPENRISMIQGDFRFLQCGMPCHDQLWDSLSRAKEAYLATEDCRIPSELVPKCPKCGAVCEPWVRGFTFLEGAHYREEYLKVKTFIEKYRDKRLLFLELGVGRMTPMFIQEPFWNLTYSLAQARYVTINPLHALVPSEITEKSQALHESILDVLWSAAMEKGADGDGDL